MRVIKLIFSISTLAILIVSCKNNEKQPLSDTTTETSTPSKKLPKKVLTEEDKKMLSSVLNKMMTTPDLKTFTSFAVTAGVTDALSKEEGPFTVLGFTNTAYDALLPIEKKQILKTNNTEGITQFVKNNIVKGSFTFESLLQEINTSGKVSLETLGGALLSASKEGEAIIITDVRGKKAKIITKNILGSNGVVHTLDAVLNIQ